MLAEMASRGKNPYQTGDRLTGRLHFSLALLILIATLAAVFPKALFFGEELFLRDLEMLDEPLRRILVESTERCGWPPQWNEYLAGGQPLAANPHFAVFHPLTWLFFLLPWRWAFLLQVVGPIVLTFFGFRYFLNSVGFADIACVFGALVWTFGGLGMSLTNLLPILWTLAPLPWALGCAAQLVDMSQRKTGDKPRGGSRLFAPLVGLSVAFALCMLGGEPLSLVICGAAVSLFVLMRSRSGSRWATLRRSAAAGLVALGLSACVWIPGVGLLGKTVRGTDPARDRLGVWSLPPQRLVEVLTPPLEAWPGRTVTAEWPIRHSLYPNQRGPLIASLYPGLAVAVLALAGLATRPREFEFEIVLIAWGFVMALGRFSVVWQVLSDLPGLDIGRYPEKWTALILLGLILVASRVVHVLWSADPDQRRRMAHAVLVGLLILGCLRGGAELIGVTGFAAPHRALAWLALAAGAIAVAGFAAAALLRHQRLRTACVLASVPAMLLELVICSSHLIPTRPATHDAPPAHFLVPMVRHHDANRLFHLASLRGQPPALPWMAPPPTPARWGLRTIFDTDIDSTQLRWSRWATQENLDLMATLPALSRRQLARVGVSAVARLVNREATGRDKLAVTLTPVADPTPRISCVDAVLHVDGWHEWREVAAIELERHEQRFVVVEGGHSRLPTDPGPCRLSVTLDLPHHLVAEAFAPGPNPAVLQVNQTWDPSWRVFVDGHETELERADIAFGSFALPVGAHTVELRYHDSLVSLGMAVSVGTLLLVGVSLCLLGFSRRAS